MGCDDCGVSIQQVQEGFLSPPKVIEDELKAMVEHNRRFYIAMLGEKEVFPDGAGDETYQTYFKRSAGPQYAGHEIFRKDDTGDCAGDPCSYDWQEIDWGLEEKKLFMQRAEFRTKEFCIDKIRTLRQYEDVMGQIPRMLADISLDIEEQYIRNTFEMLAIKLLPFGNDIGEGDGSDLRMYPTFAPGTRLAQLDINLMEYIYDRIYRTGAEGVAELDGGPLYMMVGSRRTLRNALVDSAKYFDVLKRDDAGRDAFLTKFNIANSYGGMFSFAYDEEAPRYALDVDNNLVRVLPWLDVPTQTGTRRAANPEYAEAPYELLIMIPRNSIGLTMKRPINSLGGGSQFGLDAGDLQWNWFFDKCKEDPIGKKGYWYTTYRIGYKPLENSDAVFGLLVETKPYTSSRTFVQPGECALDAPDCGDPPAAVCPCPETFSCCSGIDPLRKLVTVDPALGLVATDPISLQVNDGTVVDGIVQAVGVDEAGCERYDVLFTEIVDCACVTGVACSTNLACTARVLDCTLCRQDADEVGIVLNVPVDATVADTITVLQGNGETATLTITEVDGTTVYVTQTFQDFCEAEGIVKGSDACVDSANCTCPTDFTVCTPAP